MSSEKTTNEEEKKHEELGGFESKGEDEDKDEDKDETDDEVTLLTPQLASIFGDHSFGTEDSLHQFMDEKGIGDLRIVLVDGKPRLVMPTDQHNSFTSKHVFKFAVLHGKWGYVSGTHNVHLSTNSRREPDVSFFGYVRCMRDKNGVLELKDKGAVPDVIIQFSWKNKRGYEEEAMDDMMNLSLENERGTLSRDRPRVGYLIKVRFSKKRPLPGSIKGTNTQDLEGLDIFRLPHGTTVNDAMNGNNGASKWAYFPSTGLDDEIHIRPQDLGITGFWSVFWGGYRVKVSEIFDEMNSFHKARQSQGLAT